MKIIRTGVFETNSSSTHSLTIASREDYESWKRGDLIFERHTRKFVPAVNIAQNSDDWTTKYLEYYSQRLENGFVYQGRFYSTMDDVKNSVSIDADTLSRFAENEQGNRDDDRYTYRRYYDSISCDYMETFTEEYTTKSGDGVVVFGYYGYE